MSASPEPLAAILAEMRDERIIHIEDADATRCLLRNLADRIEAAAERERSITDEMLAVKDRLLPHPDPEHAPPVFVAPGSSAAMREALIYVRDLMRSVKDGDRVSSLAFLGVVERALAAPARNCDRFATAEEASAAFRRERPDEASSDFAANLIYWLFAPAEGGVK